MAVKVSDLFPKRTYVEVNDVKLEIFALSLEQIIQLLTIYRQDLIMMFTDSAEGNLNLVTLVATAPSMAADLIGFGIHAEDQHGDIKLLPGFTQIELLAAIWAASVPDPKKLMALLSGAMAGLHQAGVMPSLAEEFTPPNTALPTETVPAPESTT